MQSPPYVQNTVAEIVAVQKDLCIQIKLKDAESPWRAKYRRRNRCCLQIYAFKLQIFPSETILNNVVTAYEGSIVVFETDINITFLHYA